MSSFRPLPNLNPPIVSTQFLGQVTRGTARAVPLGATWSPLARTSRGRLCLCCNRHIPKHAYKTWRLRARDQAQRDAWPTRRLSSGGVFGSNMQSALLLVATFVRFQFLGGLPAQVSQGLFNRVFPYIIRVVFVYAAASTCERRLLGLVSYQPRIGCCSTLDPCSKTLL